MKYYGRKLGYDPAPPATEHLRKYWDEVREGKRPAPKRAVGVVRRVTRKTLDGSHGPDRGRRIIITFIPGNDRVEDMLALKPERTRRVEHITIADIYRYAIRCRVQRRLLEKARERKAKKAERLARERRVRAERKLLDNL